MKFINSRRARSGGVALVMVLLLIALLAALVLSFFAAVRVETVSSASYSERTKAQMYADSAKNLAIGQIQKGTEGVDGGKVLAWASQPGMIRTWDQTGDPVKAYKLYSSDEMIVEGGYKSQEEIAKDVPDDWKTRPEEYVDLNSPVLAEDPKGPITKDGGTYTARFPIISGNNLKPATAAAAGTGAKTYEATIEGFWIDGQQDVSEGEIRPDNNPVPMPVRWLYMLQDGKIAVAGSNGTLPGASKTNPAVARVAFWTDDETTKVNINTASEGVFWDRPYNGGMTERNFGNNIPAQNEFASFPGHPATTSLSTVLGSILPVPDWINTVVDYNRLVPYYSLVPRVTEGGSRGGVLRPKGTADIIKYDADRLYSSIDEFIFKAKSVSADRDANNTKIDNNFLDQARFFLTAHSRAPEVNMFNLPRISLWPLDPVVQNSKDKLIAYCSTVNGKPFYFSRTVVQGNNPTAAAFLNTSQSSMSDWDKYPRNKVLYNYLQSLTKADIPGFGGSLLKKYPGNLRDQLLTEMVDLLRSGVNTASSELDPVYNFAPPGGVMGQGQVIPLTLSSTGSGGSDTRGFGRFMTISEASLILYHTGARTGPKGKPAANTVQAVFVMEPFCPSPGLPGWSPNARIEVTGLDGFALGGLSLNLPRTASMNWNTIEGKWEKSKPQKFPAGSTAFPATRQPFYFHPNGNTSLTLPRSVEQKSGDQYYPFVSSGPVELKMFDVGEKGNHPLELRGASVQIKVYGPKVNEDPVQTLTLNFPTTTIFAPEPLPKDDQYSYVNFTRRIPDFNGSINIKTTLIPFADAASVPSTAPDTTLLKLDPEPEKPPAGYKGYNHRGDIVRSMEASISSPLFGDLRALSLFGNTVDTSTLFGPHPFYKAFETAAPLTPRKANDPSGAVRNLTSDYNYRMAESLRSDENVYNGQFGTYVVANINNYINEGQLKGTFLTAGSFFPLQTFLSYIQRDAIPSVPTGLFGAYMKGASTMPGDWDAGLGVCSDGPYINLPDQGNSSIKVESGLQAEVAQIFGGYFGRGEFSTSGNGATAAATFSPNRQIASAVSFGSLSAGVDPKNVGEMWTWRTLLFCANPAAAALHPGFGKSRGGSNPYPPYSEAPDHAFLDLFTMPIVEGYPISEPMSTAGKVNMNYQIAPFTYIHRSTGIRAVMKKVVVTAVPTTVLTNTSNEDAIKSANVGDRAGWGGQARYGINLDEKTGTLRQFEQRFEKGDLFRSASEVCDMFLVPKRIPGIKQSYRSTDPSGFAPGSGEINFSNNSVANWWKSNTMTADNQRETPYGHIYPRLTTKSNSYTVHVRVQTLAKSINTSQGAFIDPKRGGATDTVTGEYRGSFEIERYLDPNSLEQSGLDLATVNPEAPSKPLGQFYKYRTISAKEFRP